MSLLQNQSAIIGFAGRSVRDAHISLTEVALVGLGVAEVLLTRLASFIQDDGRVMVATRAKSARRMPACT
jgi:hypothetical protein